jgi:uncharacterized protein (TIGR03435 family)
MGMRFVRGIGFGVVLIALAATVADGQVPDWQKAAGGKRTFEVASVKRSGPDSAQGDLSLDAADNYFHTGGLFTANATLINYIIFAYRITDSSQYPLIQAQLPKWAQTEPFYMDARAEGNPTKDEVRLMMQALLAERFKLVLHTETRQLPAYLLELDKPGTLGAKLNPRLEDGLCTVAPEKPAPNAKAPASRAYCGLIFSPAEELLRMNIMGYTMQQMAGALSTAGTYAGGLEALPIVDETGLTGKYDIELTFVRVRRGSADSQADVVGTTFIEALKKQGGLRLVKQVAPVEVYVVDHVERPSEN